MITFDTPHGPANAYVALPPGGAGPGVLVLHAWWGLNAFFANLAEQLAAAGFVALAPDLNEGQVAATIEEAKRLRGSANFERTQAVALGAVDALRAHPAVRAPGRLGALGFSMGASWASYLATQRPDALAAVVMFYGADDSDFSLSRAAYQLHFAATDDWEPAESLQQMQAALQAAGRAVEAYTYPGTQHWFFENDRPEFNPDAAHLAWERTVDFLRRGAAS
jgi:carboxymethylenebutenolidase